ncbi:hypothetical protein M1394_02845 [Candidatus Marsarchaeota archaeon]|nr:hypothetical protein [Candidatus Marsarchaeota archaeon]
MCNECKLPRSFVTKNCDCTCDPELLKEFNVGSIFLRFPGGSLITYCSRCVHRVGKPKATR